MQDVQIILSGLWVAVMLTYLLGDVLRIFAGDFKAGEIEGKKITYDGDRYIDVDSNRYAFAFLDVSISCESLGKYHCCYRFVCF
jgi:hypothetical protein